MRVRGFGEEVSDEFNPSIQETDFVTGNFGGKLKLRGRGVEQTVQPMMKISPMYRKNTMGCK